MNPFNERKLACRSSFSGHGGVLLKPRSSKIIICTTTTVNTCQNLGLQKWVCSWLAAQTNRSNNYVEVWSLLHLEAQEAHWFAYIFAALCSPRGSLNAASIHALCSLGTAFLQCVFSLAERNSISLSPSGAFWRLIEAACTCTIRKLP